MAYSITIMNDASLTDGQGAIHTWLMINGSGKATKYFSFSNSDNLSLIGVDSDGKSSVDEHLIARKPTETFDIAISKQQYDLLIREIVDFYTRDPKPKYDLTPDREGDYNCVTASSAILEAAGIEFLKKIQSPFGVKHRINGHQSTHAVEGVLTAKDAFDFSFRFTYHLLQTSLGSTEVRPTLKCQVFEINGCTNAELSDFDLNSKGGVSNLHLAAAVGDFDIVRNLIEVKMMSVSTKNGNNNIPLHYAAVFGHLKIVKYFIDEKGVDFKAINGYKMTPLHFAALGGHIEVAKYLVNKHHASQDQFDVRDGVNATPLHYAASSGSLNLVEYLVEKGSNVNAIDGYQFRPVHRAVGPDGTLEIVKYLIHRGAIAQFSSQNGNKAIHISAYNGHFDIVRYFIEEMHIPFDQPYAGSYILHFASVGGHLAIVKYLIETKGATIDIRNDIKYTPLHYAAFYGHLDVVRYLLKKGAIASNADKPNTTPLDFARKKNHADVVNCLQSMSDCVSQRIRRSIEPKYSIAETALPNSIMNFSPQFSIDYHIPAINNDTGSSHGSFDANIDTTIANATFLADLFIRKLNGIKYSSLEKVPSPLEKTAELREEAYLQFMRAMRQNFKK